MRPGRKNSDQSWSRSGRSGCHRPQRKWFSRNHVHQELWGSGADEKGVHEGQLAEQKAHGGVEATVHPNQEYHDQICSYSRCENSQDQCEYDPRSLTLHQKPQEGEVRMTCSSLMWPHERPRAAGRQGPGRRQEHVQDGKGLQWR